MTTAFGIAVCTYNRAARLAEVLEAVQKTAPEDCKLILCDDGSTDDTLYVAQQFPNFIFVRGPNRGVAHNKNRALVNLQSCKYMAICEDDLVPQAPGWFERYVQAAEFSGIHHFCRVQDKEVEEALPEFGSAMAAQGLAAIYGPSPRGDLTFLTKKVLDTVGGFHPDFQGVGYAHGEWSNRVVASGLVPHPNKWVDIRDSRDAFLQVGDTEGGRWTEESSKINGQKKANRAVYRRLKATQYLFCPLEIS